MDVIVTIPKGYDMSTKAAADIAYWRVSRAPLKAKRYDSIYFVHDGKIVEKAEIIRCEHHSIDFKNLEGLPEPHLPMKGFRNFRYFDFEAYKKEVS